MSRLTVLDLIDLRPEMTRADYVALRDQITDFIDEMDADDEVPDTWAPVDE